MEDEIKTIYMLNVEEKTAVGRISLLADGDNMVVDVMTSGLENTRLQWILAELDLVGQFVKDAEKTIGMIRRVTFTRTRFTYIIE